MSMGVAAFIGHDALGKPEMGITFTEEHIQVQVKLAGPDNIDSVINTLIKGLKEAAADLKREASGLVVANGALPNGLLKPQGG